MLVKLHKNAPSDRISRKEFLGTVSGLAALPVLAAAHPVDVISQAELQARIDYLNAGRREMLALRRRIDAGAVVEPGAMVAEIVLPGREYEPAEDYQSDEDYGLFVGPIENAYSAR